jgi:hypothetical protein
MTQNVNTKDTEKLADQDQQSVEREDKNCASYNWNIRNN